MDNICLFFFLWQILPEDFSKLLELVSAICFVLGFFFVIIGQNWRNWRNPYTFLMIHYISLLVILGQWLKKRFGLPETGTVQF